MIAEVELQLQRDLTLQFILADYVDLNLQRKTRIPDGSGGHTDTLQPIGVQRFRLIPSADGAEQRLTADGLAVSPSYMLMGRWSADVERGDEFELDGRRYQIGFINQNRQYELKAEVAYLG